MKIAQVAPLRESIPPQRYGGTERVISYLTEELVRLGHDVTLFAAGDSSTSATLYAGDSVRRLPVIFTFHSEDVMPGRAIFHSP